ncbi:MAG: hypothetical protein J3R72DRAFT_390811, partial [Linnemannia gamsii]
MVPNPAQYHHYIPRFILRTFADNFSLITSHTEYIATSTPVSHYINVYQVADYTIELNDHARVYGIYDMYRDITSDDKMKFEKLLGIMECTSATFIRKIWSGGDLSLTRVQLVDMKKFLCIMMYRGEHRWREYHDGLLNFKTHRSLKIHMDNNHIEKPQDVWFGNLKWFIETPTSDITDEYMKYIYKEAKNASAGTTNTEYQGPIYATALCEFGEMMPHYVCVWQADEGSEFILSDNCFGAFEGNKGIPFHSFFIVSPRYAIVLVN